MNAFQLYQAAIKKLDDYFEYTFVSRDDQVFVHKVLSDLTDDIKKLDTVSIQGYTVEDIKKVREFTGTDLSRANLALRLADGNADAAIEIIHANNRRTL